MSSSSFVQYTINPDDAKSHVDRLMVTLSNMANNSFQPLEKCGQYFGFDNDIEEGKVPFVEYALNLMGVPHLKEWAGLNIEENHELVGDNDKLKASDTTLEQLERKKAIMGQILNLEVSPEAAFANVVNRFQGERIEETVVILNHLILLLDMDKEISTDFENKDKKQSLQYFLGCGDNLSPMNVMFAAVEAIDDGSNKNIEQLMDAVHDKLSQSPS